MQLFAWSLDKNAAAIGGASKPLSTVFSVVYPIWKVAAAVAVAVVEIEAAVIEIAVEEIEAAVYNRSNSSRSCRNGGRNGNSSRLIWL